MGSKKIKVNRIKKDNQGRILIVDDDIDEEPFVALISLYSANTEMNKIKAMCELDELLGNFRLDSYKKILLFWIHTE